MAKVSIERKKRFKTTLPKGTDNSTNSGSTYEEIHMTILDDVRSGHIVPGQIIHVQFQFKPVESNGTFPPPWLIPR